MAGFILILASMLFIPSLAIIVLIAVCVGAYYLISSRNLEYEYSITNGDITIDKIINRRNRKRIVSMDAHDIEAMGKYNPTEHSAKSYTTRLTVSVTDDGKDAWYFAGNHPKKGVFWLYSVRTKSAYRNQTVSCKAGIVECFW